MLTLISAMRSSAVVKAILSFWRDDDQGSAFKRHRGLKLTRLLFSKKKNIAFTDRDHQVKGYDPEKNAVTDIIGSGQEENSDGSEKSASFVLVHGICTYDNSLFVTDVAVGTIKVVTGLSKTDTFFKKPWTSL